MYKQSPVSYTHLDVYKRQVLVVSLLTIALTPYIHLILLASLLTGICSVMPQIFIPIAAQFSTPKTKEGERAEYCNYCSQYVFHILWTVLMFAIVKILTNVGVSRWIAKEKDEFKRDMEK